MLVSHLPDLQNVVLGAGGHHESLVQIPRDVRDLCGVAAMDENQFRRPVSPLLLSLGHSAAGKVPYHDSSVRAGGRKQVAHLSAEFDLVDFIFVLPKTEQFGFHVSCVPDAHTAIC